MLTVHLSRFTCLDVTTNLEHMAAEVARAAANGAGLCVFPEGFLHGYSRTLDPALARRRFAELSGNHPDMCIVFGAISEGGANRMTVWKAGTERASYDKVHLFAPNGECELWQPGNHYVAVREGEWTLGLINCNDLRFPEQARALRLQGGANLLVVVAWWPWRRTHIFEALLRARAIENGCFAVGCCIANSQTPGEIFHGAGNYAFDPLGQALPSADDVTYKLDPARFKELVVDPVGGFVDIQEVRVV